MGVYNTLSLEDSMSTLAQVLFLKILFLRHFELIKMLLQVLDRNQSFPRKLKFLGKAPGNRSTLFLYIKIDCH